MANAASARAFTFGRELEVGAATVREPDGAIAIWQSCPQGISRIVIPAEDIAAFESWLAAESRATRVSPPVAAVPVGASADARMAGGLA